MLKQLKRVEIWLGKIPRWAALILWMIAASPYVPINYFPLYDPQPLPFFPWEDRIPFMAWTSYVYVSFFVFIPVAMYLIPKERFGRVFLALCAMCWLHFVFFIFFPIYYPRPQGDCGYFFFEFVKILDQPNNCFPSLHVAISVFLAIAVWRTRGKFAGGFLFFWALLIIASTLTVKQHYALDILGGIATAALSSFLF